MHTLHEKRGRSTVTHYFSHVTEDDGTKKHVYLGTDPDSGKEKLTKLKAERVSSASEVIRDIESVQAKLSDIAEHYKPYDAIVNEIRQKQAKALHAEKLLANEVKFAFPFLQYIIFLIAVGAFATALFIFISDPSITGAAIKGIDTAASAVTANSIVSILAVGVILAGIIVGTVVYRYNHKYDKYKPQ